MNSTCFQIVEDQEGNLVSIAESDRKALVLGMALHEKAKALIKNKEYFSALTLLQKADKEGFAKWYHCLHINNNIF